MWLPQTYCQEAWQQSLWDKLSAGVCWACVLEFLLCVCGPHPCSGRPQPTAWSAGPLGSPQARFSPRTAFQLLIPIGARGSESRGEDCEHRQAARKLKDAAGAPL